ncbi:hypothetical protein D8I30_06340 [Brevundimonas naejangsanensis]|uniref:Uncharacterized protein n=1 Tax=Brevundimonas naejangsanensis TaxID=588932 RepID=A0A494RLL1_9CAUL|nr:hypothetical protein [Brevundimonas naejangsanensis]AYG94842.1 hypothetical protein D8I30_06340 [Brevundimonas naejangsanensis]
MTHQDPHSHSADPVQHGEAVEAQYVRQGRSGRRILVILLLSAGATAVLLLGMWAISNSGFQRQNNASEPAPVEAPVEAPAAELAKPAT